MQKMHVISHTHWDREWYLTFQQFRLKLVHLIDKLIDILAEDPDFKYFMLDGQTIVLDDYLLMRPEMEPLLRQYIQSRRILIGPWHILPDMFLVSPEAHIRNLLQGARTASKFGPKMPIGYIPDPFGHPGQVPQILNGFGIKAAALWRGLGDQPAELWWQSPDGSKILLAYLRDSYGNGANLPVHNPEAFTEQIAIAGNSLSAHSAVNDHLIMLGTDHMEPSRYTSSSIAHANRNLPGTQVIHSTLPDYFDSIKARIDQLEQSIPTVQGELRACNRSPLLPGVLSSRMWIKQRNHHSQNLLEKWAEPFNVFAENMISRQDKPTTPVEIASNRIRNTAPIIRQTWRLLMENHPHDSICGCSIDQVHDEMKPRFDQVDQIGEEITLQALQALSQATHTLMQAAFSTITIFNPHNSSHCDLVEVELQIPEEIERFELFAEGFKVIPFELISSSFQTLANLMLPKSIVRDTIGAISEGRVAGAAITSVTVSRQGHIVTIDAILDDHGQPNIPEWQQAEAEIARYEVDPGITHFRVIAHTPPSSRIRFVSPKIPALGWNTVWVRAVMDSSPSQPDAINPLLKPFLPLALRLAQSKFGEKILFRQNTGDEAKPPYIIQNDNFIVEANPSDGTLTLTDKHTNAVFSGLNRIEDGGDAGDEYNYSPPVCDSFYTPRPVSLRVFRRRLFQTLEIQYALKVPAQLTHDRKNRSKKMLEIPITSRVSLFPGSERVEIHTEVDNVAKDHRLRVHFPAPFKVNKADFDGHFEVVQRQLGVPEKIGEWVEDPRPETHQGAFTSVANGEIGLTIANRGLPEVEALDNSGHAEIALTLLRCVGWLSRDDIPVRKGHAGPAFETPGAQMPGKWGFDYAIIPHKGNWLESYAQAFAFQTTLRAVETDLHSGELPNHGSFITTSPDAFVISTVKAAENGKGWLVRGYNISPETIQINLKPFRRFSHAVQVNLAEEEIAPLDMDIDGSIKTLVNGHQIVNVMFSN